MPNIHLKYKPESILNVVGILLIIVMAVIAPFFGGYDYRVAYRGDTLAGTFGAHSGFPYPAAWFIYPFAILPETVGYIVWNIANAICFMLAIRYWKGNIFALSLFIGTFWTFYGGQIEGFMAGALVLMMLPSPWLAGIGITLLTFKPQIGIFPIAYFLINKRDWRALVIPFVIYVASFLKWGWWIPKWLSTIQSIGTTGITMVSMVSLFPYGLILLPLLWKYKKSLKIWMYVQSLTIPYFPIYSLAPLFTISSPPWWVNLVIWCFYLLLSKYLVFSKFGFVFPLGLLIYEIWKMERENRPALPVVNESV